jgi:hypothetical protein
MSDFAFSFTTDLVVSKAVLPLRYKSIYANSVFVVSFSQLVEPEVVVKVTN